MEALASVTYISALGQIPLANAFGDHAGTSAGVTSAPRCSSASPSAGGGGRRSSSASAGVLIVLRPGPEGFTAAALTVVACVFFTATRDLCTRRIGTDVPVAGTFTVTTSLVTTLSVRPYRPARRWQPMSTTSLSHIPAPVCF